MPCLRVETNLPRSSFDINKMSAELRAEVAEALKVPISSCMVTIIPDAHIQMGAGSGANTTMACVSLMTEEWTFSITRKNKSRAAALFPILNKYLGVQGQHAFFSTLYANTEYIKLSSFSSLLGMKS